MMKPMQRYYDVILLIKCCYFVFCGYFGSVMSNNIV